MSRCSRAAMRRRTSGGSGGAPAGGISPSSRASMTRSQVSRLRTSGRSATSVARSMPAVWVCGPWHWKQYRSARGATGCALAPLRAEATMAAPSAQTVTRVKTAARRNPLLVIRIPASGSSRPLPGRRTSACLIIRAPGDCSGHGPRVDPPAGAPGGRRSRPSKGRRMGRSTSAAPRAGPHRPAGRRHHDTLGSAVDGRSRRRAPALQRRVRTGGGNRAEPREPREAAALPRRQWT